MSRSSTRRSPGSRELGARRIEPDAIEEHGSRWVVMTDPEGNEFCVCNAGQGGG